MDTPTISFGMDVDSGPDGCTSDRLIPSRGTCGSVGQMKLDRDENWAPRNEYHEVLSQNVLGRDSLANEKVLSYKHKPQRQESAQNDLKVLYSCNREGAPKPKPTRALPQTAMRVLDAPSLRDDFYDHPIDWSARNVMAVALSDSVFLFDAASGKTERLLQLPAGDVTAIRWTGEGVHMGVCTSLGEVQLWDGMVGRQLRSLRGHGGRIASCAWHEHTLSSGAADSEIHHHDVRARDHLVGRLTGAHDGLVCGLEYSAEGMLASGGNDNVVCVWDRSLSNQTPTHKLIEHRAAVKALKWCPWQRHMLATGGGTADRQICLWNSSSGRLATSVDAESQVTAMLWSPQDRELVTAHGFSRNQISLWKYPSLTKTADLEGHTGRLLGLAQSPDKSVVCSASADETLRFWRISAPQSDEKTRERTKAPNPILKTIR